MSITRDKEKVSLTDQAYKEIRIRLVAGMFHVGEFLDVNSLIEELGVSRTPIREAALRLHSEGLLEIIPKKGIRVKPLSADDLYEIYQIISGLELIAASNLAKSKPDRETLAPLYLALDDMQKATDENDSNGWATADEKFHRSILSLNDNQRLADLGFFHRDLAQRAHFIALRLFPIEDKQRSVKAHRKLADTLLEGDEGKVLSLHKKQRDQGVQNLVKIINEYGLTLL